MQTVEKHRYKNRLPIPGWLAASILCAISICCHAQPEPIPANASFEAGFSPGQSALQTVLSGINSAQKQILVAAYSFSSKPIAKALVAAQRRGVNVFVVADMTDNSKGYTATTFLANEGIPVRLNGRYAILHSKFMVIDGAHLQLGSFNYSAAAVDRNEENVLLLRNVAPLAQQYTTEWKRLWEEGSDLRKAY